MKTFRDPPLTKRAGKLFVDELTQVAAGSEMYNIYKQKLIYVSDLPQKNGCDVCSFAMQFYRDVSVIHQAVTPWRVKVFRASANVFGIANHKFCAVFNKINRLHSCSSAVTCKYLLFVCSLNENTFLK